MIDRTEMILKVYDDLKFRRFTKSDWELYQDAEPFDNSTDPLIADISNDDLDMQIVLDSNGIAIMLNDNPDDDDVGNTYLLKCNNITRMFQILNFLSVKCNGPKKIRFILDTFFEVHY